MSSLARNLIRDSRITTTTAKAKELRPMVEKLITKGRVGSPAALRFCISQLGTTARALTLVQKVAPKYKERAGGYTRIIKLPKRLVDGSPMALIELV